MKTLFRVALVLIAALHSPLLANRSGECLHAAQVPQLPDSSGCAINSTWPLVLADDWSGTESGWVKEICFWGGWHADDIGTVDSFAINIHREVRVAGSPSGKITPGETLWERRISNFQIAGPFLFNSLGWFDPVAVEPTSSDHNLCYRFDIVLDTADWFWEVGSTTYWLSVSAFVQYGANTQWGWQSTRNHWRDFAGWKGADSLRWVEMDYYYVPGDVNDDGYVSTNDATFLTLDCYLPIWPPVEPPFQYPGTSFFAGADANGNCEAGCGVITDAVYLTNYIFSGGPPPRFCPAYPPLPSLSTAFAITTVCFCGDVDGNRIVNISDAVYLVAYIFSGGPAPQPPSSGDPDCNGFINISDAVYLINYIFSGGAAPCAGCK